MLALQNKAFNTQIIKNQYKRLLERKLEIEPEYRKLKEEIDELNNQIAGLDQALRAAQVDTQKLREKISPPKPQIERIQQKEESLPDWIYKLLQAYNKPMHYVEITEHLLRDGFVIGGKDRANTVLAYISRNKRRFVKVPEKGRGFYNIKE